MHGVVKLTLALVLHKLTPSMPINNNGITGSTYTGRNAFNSTN